MTGAPGASDRSVTYGVDAMRPDEPATIRLRPAPDADPILIVSLDARHVETVLQAARLLRPTLEWADEVNRVDKLVSTCERALGIYYDWVEERERAERERAFARPSSKGSPGDRMNEGISETASE